MSPVVGADTPAGQDKIGAGGLHETPIFVGRVNNPGEPPGPDPIVIDQGQQGRAADATGVVICGRAVK